MFRATLLARLADWHRAQLLTRFSLLKIVFLNIPYIKWAYQNWSVSHLISKIWEVMWPCNVSSKKFDFAISKLESSGLPKSMVYVSHEVGGLSRKQGKKNKLKKATWFWQGARLGICTYDKYYLRYETVVVHNVGSTNPNRQADRQTDRKWCIWAQHATFTGGFKKEHEERSEIRRGRELGRPPPPLDATI